MSLEKYGSSMLSDGAKAATLELSVTQNTKQNSELPFPDTHERRRVSRNRNKSGSQPTQASIPPSPRQKLEVQKGAREACVKHSAMASADLLRREEEFYESLFDSAKGDAAAAKTRGQMIERKIEALEDMATKVSNRRSRRWLNDRLLIELVPRLHVEEIKGLFAPPPFGEEAPLSAFCRTSVGEWDAFRTIDMDVEARFMQRMKQSSAKQKNLVNEDESIVLNAWRRIDCQTREAMKRNFLPELLEIYEERIRAFIEDSVDKDVLVLNVQDPFQRLLLHGVCEFYNVTSTTTGTSQDGKPWKTTTIKKRSGTGVAPRITLVSFLRTKKNGSNVVS